MNEKRNGKELLERAVEELRAAEPTPAETEAASERVWTRLANTAAAATEGVVEGCAGFVALLPEYRAGTLPAARRELLEDHLQGCVECRRALWRSQGGRDAQRPELGRPAWRRWALAAAAVLVVGVGVKFGLDRLATPPVAVSAVAERVDGSLFLVEQGGLAPLAAGQSIDAADVIRAGRGSRAVLRLADGSRVEVDEHAELSLRPRRDGTAVALARGNIIVEAAHQRPGRRLYVDAPDCEVAVKGTVFTVAAGPKGSRVSVLDGEVWVEQGGDVTKLARGGQTTTQANLAPVPIAQEVAWSSDPERYTALLQEISAVSREMMAKLADVPLRYDTTLVSMLPADAFVVATAPNVAEEMAGAGQDLIGRIQANPQLAGWLAEHRAERPEAPDMIEVLSRFRELGARVGDEVALAVAGSPEAGSRFLLIAEATDESGLRAAIEDDLQRLRSQAGHEVPVVIVDDPAALPAETGRSLLVMIRSGLVVATDSRDELARLAALPGSAQMPATPFFSQIAESYRDGVTWLLAANLERIGGSHGDDAVAEELGLRDARTLLFEHKRLASQSQLRGSLSFAGDRRGVASWLGAPAPMGALEFVSPQAYAVGAMLARDPEQIVDELLGAISRHDPEAIGRLAGFEREHGLSVRDDLAAPLGGEFLLAVDGPVLPEPAWKAVVLVEDQERLQGTLARLVADLSARLVAEQHPGLVLETEDDGGVRFYSVRQEGKAARVQYTFRDGYWLLAGNRVILKDALRVKASGLSLAADGAFRASLPADGQGQYSALAFVNSGELGKALASAVPSGAQGEAGAALGELRAMLANSSTMAFCVTAKRDRILFTGTGLDILNPTGVLSGLAGIAPIH